MLMEKASGPYVRQRCQIPVHDPWNHSLYIISVRPKEEEKFIKSSDNSEFAPSLLRGMRSQDGRFHCVTPITQGSQWLMLTFVTFNKMQASEQSEQT